MRCNEVQEMFPEYLAGTLDENVKMQIDNHLKTCETCSGELKILNEDIKLEFTDNIIDKRKILKKTRFKFNMAILRVVIITLGILYLILTTPFIAYQIRGSMGRENQFRALIDIIQFTQPDKINMWANSFESYSFSETLKIGVRPVIGHSYGEQFIYETKMSFITGKVTAPVHIGANFIHPDLFKNASFDSMKDKEKQREILRKNSDNTVATVDYSLKKTISLKDVENLIGNYDVEVCWMAVEAGIENLQPKNLYMENQQVYQWGIPSKLFSIGNAESSEFKKGNVQEYEKSILNELKWLDENKNILKPDKQLLKVNGINNSVEEKASYILKNGIKVYGLRITGPSSELIKLTDQIDPCIMILVDMDFWNW